MLLLRHSSAAILTFESESSQKVKNVSMDRLSSFGNSFEDLMRVGRGLNGMEMVKMVKMVNRKWTLEKGNQEEIVTAVEMDGG